MTSLQYGLGTASWQYLDNNLLARQTLPNGCTTDYGYNAANQLTDLVNKTSGGNTLSGYLDFLYLGTGDLSTVASSIPGATNLQGQVDYGYDHKRQLTLEDSDRNGGYSDANSFDGAGNATTFRNAAKTYNPDNQLTGPGTYVYDGNGNPTTWAGTSLTFDVENRMTAYGTTLTAGSRGDGLRAWKNTASGKTYFLYDGISVVCELDSSGNVLAGSTYGAAGLLSRGSVQYQFDNLGDATVRLDGSGNVLSYRLFDAWGNELSSGSEPYGYRARYGYYADGETGLIALAFRYYAPGVGRFLNRDPIAIRGGANQYAYARSSVVRGVDPSGLFPWLVVGIIVAIIVAVVAICQFVKYNRCRAYGQGLKKEWDAKVASLYIDTDSAGANAFRHCYGSCIGITDEPWPGCWEYGLNYHEKGSPDAVDSSADKANNTVGIAIGRDVRSDRAKCEKLCLEKLQSGGLDCRGRPCTPEDMPDTLGDR